MDLQSYIDEKNISKYQLAKLSGIPKTTIMDICSGKSNLEKCSAHTVQLLSKALNCSMEFIMTLNSDEYKYDSKTGLPKNEGYFESNLPLYLKESIELMNTHWEILDSGKEDLRWDVAWDNLNSDINCAEVDQNISSEQAWFLREKYLRMVRED